MATGQKCKIRTEAYPERIYEGFVSRLMPIADRNKAAIPVRVKVNVPREEEGVYLKPDMTAMVSFLKDPPTPANAKKTAPERVGDMKTSSEKTNTEKTSTAKMTSEKTGPEKAIVVKPQATGSPNTHSAKPPAS